MVTDERFRVSVGQGGVKESFCRPAVPIDLRLVLDIDCSGRLPDIANTARFGEVQKKEFTVEPVMHGDVTRHDADFDVVEPVGLENQIAAWVVPEVRTAC